MKAPTSESDPAPEELFDRFRRQGDVAALGRLFDETAPELLRIAHALEPDPAAADDALQETWLAAIRRPERYEPGRRVLPWLVGILQLEVRMIRRGERRIVDPERLARNRDSVDPAREAARREDAARVHEALEALPEPYREPAVLRWREGLEPTEIARRRGDRPGTVRSLLSRALARLRRLAGVPAVFGFGRARGLRSIRRVVLREAAARFAVQAAAPLSIIGGILAQKGLLAVVLMCAVAGAGWRLVRGGGRPVQAPDRGDRAMVPVAVRTLAKGSGPAAGPDPTAPQAGTPTKTTPAAWSVRGVVRDADGRNVPRVRVRVLRQPTASSTRWAPPTSRATTSWRLPRPDCIGFARPPTKPASAGRLRCSSIRAATSRCRISCFEAQGAWTASPGIPTERRPWTSRSGPGRNGSSGPTRKSSTAGPTTCLLSRASITELEVISSMRSRGRAGARTHNARGRQFPAPSLLRSGRDLSLG